MRGGENVREGEDVPAWSSDSVMSVISVCAQVCDAIKCPLYISCRYFDTGNGS